LPNRLGGLEITNKVAKSETWSDERAENKTISLSDWTKIVENSTEQSQRKILIQMMDYRTEWKEVKTCENQISEKQIQRFVAK
jgi:hypothetical protein